MNKKIMLLIPILLGIMFVMPLMSAAVAVFTSPATNTNHTSAISVIVTYVNSTGNNITSPLSANTNFYYNSSASATWTAVTCGSAVITNTTYSCTIAITAITDRKNFGLNVTLGNASFYNASSATVQPLAVDDTAPVVSLSLETQNMNTRDSLLIQWTSSDATIGLSNTVASITSPDSQKCALINYTDANGRYALVDEQTKCSGTYTVNVTATDYAGNTATSVSTFEASLSGLSKTGSNTLGGAGQSSFSQGSEINAAKKNFLPLGESETNVAIILILGFAFYYLLKKK